jgi:hypothetical protein
MKEAFLMNPENIIEIRKLTFIYELNYAQIDLGRPKADNITIDVIDNSGSLFAN